MAREIVQGHCPVGCGPTLYLSPLGLILCARPDCPRPTAAAEVLSDGETLHVVELRTHDFTVRHPLRERLDDALLQCQLHEHLRAGDGPPYPIGRYRVEAPVGDDDRWTWEAVL